MKKSSLFPDFLLGCLFFFWKIMIPLVYPSASVHYLLFFFFEKKAFSISFKNLRFSCLCFVFFFFLFSPSIRLLILVSSSFFFSKKKNGKNGRRLDETDVPRTRWMTTERTQTSLAQQRHRTQQWPRESSIAQSTLDAFKKIFHGNKKMFFRFFSKEELFKIVFVFRNKFSVSVKQKRLQRKHSFSKRMGHKSKRITRKIHKKKKH